MSLASASATGSATAPSSTATRTYAHFNPVSGLTYKLTPGLTVYFGYSQSNGPRRRSNWPVPIRTGRAFWKIFWCPILR